MLHIAVQMAIIRITAKVLFIKILYFNNETVSIYMCTLFNLVKNLFNGKFSSFVNIYKELVL
jgi:hypothetical protein